jgi:hypothetical protein
MFLDLNVNGEHSRWRMEYTDRALVKEVLNEVWIWITITFMPIIFMITRRLLRSTSAVFDGIMLIAYSLYAFFLDLVVLDTWLPIASGLFAVATGLSVPYSHASSGYFIGVCLIHSLITILGLLPTHPLVYFWIGALLLVISFSIGGLALIGCCSRRLRNAKVFRPLTQFGLMIFASLSLIVFAEWKIPLVQFEKVS